MPRRSTKLKALVAAGAVATVGLLVGVAWAATLPGGLGPCIPGTLGCPATYNDPNNGPIAGNDNNINVFVGGDYAVRESAAEGEGKVVVLGDFDQNKIGGGIYNVGVAGVGSRVPPDPGTDYLIIGGNVTVAGGQTLAADGGVVAYGGTANGTITDSSRQDAAAITPYQGLRAELETASQCYAESVGTGTITSEFGTTTFSGDGVSALQVFNLDTDLTGPGGTATFLDFTNIPAGATVLINLTKSTAPLIINVSNGSAAWTALRQQILWNIPTNAEVNFVGTAQFQGSVLIGNPDSTTVVSMPGMNGRFFTTGDLIHSGVGAQFHAYPFDGDLPDCITPSPPSTPTPSEPAVTEPAGTNDELALSGTRAGIWLAIGVSMLLGGMALILIARRAR